MNTIALCILSRACVNMLNANLSACNCDMLFKYRHVLWLFSHLNDEKMNYQTERAFKEVSFMTRKQNYFYCKSHIKRVLCKLLI